MEIIVARKIYSLSPERILELESHLLNNKHLKLNRILENTFLIKPTFTSALPWVAKTKSTPHYFYRITFLDKKLEVAIALNKTLTITLLICNFLMPITVVVSLIYPKTFGLFVIVFFAISMQLIMAVLSYFRAKAFLNKELLSIDKFKEVT